MSEKNVNKKIVLAGGPRTGKTSVMNELKKNRFCCFQEAAREILNEFKLRGLEFKTDPIKISESIFKKRELDYKAANLLDCKKTCVFFDRGIHEITAYLRSINKSSKYWDRIPFNYEYDLIFLFEPWEKIYKKDENRIEDFSKAMQISPFIFKIYEESGTKIIKVPNTSVKDRVRFILDNI